MGRRDIFTESVREDFNKIRINASGYTKKLFLNY